ncbi:DUF488 family protein [Streptomyces verrucosisporus]|uniref:DUF488 domain-containing protein n=1 Tax=Streptomyces verrucosisporus TaxID=1695161 RepID=UPI0019D10DBC|nr:DUF488 family protein [Streptomyces verrucosisporus]MBN3930067.1 DUF488 family protein [Streptomyces verrucosisporus]
MAEGSGTGGDGRGEPGVRVRRVYEEAGPGDGRRVLVDRIWPRGLGRDAAELDEWCKEAAPSDGLRRWYGHDPQRYEEFAGRYRAELEEAGRQEAVERLRESAEEGTLTLLTATRDEERSHAAVLAEVLRETARDAPG